MQRRWWWWWLKWRQPIKAAAWDSLTAFSSPPQLAKLGLQSLSVNAFWLTEDRRRKKQKIEEQETDTRRERDRDGGNLWRNSTTKHGTSLPKAFAQPLAKVSTERMKGSKTEERKERKQEGWRWNECCNPASPYLLLHVLSRFVLFCSSLLTSVGAADSWIQA